jgi:hypothetical protein
MLRVTVELIPSYGGPRKKLAVAEIANVGGGARVGDYDARFYGGKPFEDYKGFGPGDLVCTGKVHGYERLTRNVFDLVALALQAAGFGTSEVRYTGRCEARCEGRNEAREPHACPFKSEIRNDDQTTCTCCKDCTHECAMDV